MPVGVDATEKVKAALRSEISIVKTDSCYVVVDQRFYYASLSINSMY